MLRLLTLTLGVGIVLAQPRPSLLWSARPAPGQSLPAGLDHVNIAVVDLAAASDRFRAFRREIRSILR